MIGGLEFGWSCFVNRQGLFHQLRGFSLALQDEGNRLPHLGERGGVVVADLGSARQC